MFPFPKIVLSLLLIYPVYHFGNHELQVDPLDSQIHELAPSEPLPLFVSLGSHCGPAHILRACSMRQAAFPFDWIISFDGEALIEIIEQDFLDFLNEDYLDCNASGALLHTRYHLEFIHEGDWREDRYVLNMEIFKPKYQRRINRFRDLGNFPGKVFFIRSAYSCMLMDPHRYYQFLDNIEISDAYALRLHEALKKRFPKTNISLIVTNGCDGEAFKDERKLSDDLVMIRVNYGNYASILIPTFQEFFAKLQTEEALANRP